MAACIGLTICLIMLLPTGGSGLEQLLRRQAIELQIEQLVARAGPRSSEVAAIYAGRDHEPLWVDRPCARTEIPALIDRLATADTHGLDPAAYPVARLRALSRERRDSRPLRAELDVLLTAAIVAYANDLAGQYRFMPLNDSVKATPAPPFDVAAFVSAMAAADGSPAQGIEGAAPGSAEYAALRAVLGRLRAVEAAGGWPVVPTGRTLRPGDRDPRVAVLRARVLGREVAAAVRDAELYDDDLAAAVRDLQRRDGLACDGIVGAQTLAALDVPVAMRRHQVEFSLERLRCLPHDLGSRYVRVDVLENRLRVVQGDSVVLQMRAVVGKPDRPTPQLSSQITSVEVNPSWNIPMKLAREDVLPRVKRDPGYLQQEGIQVFASWQRGAARLDPAQIDWSRIAAEDLAYKFAQVPGPANALGRVKFLFANPYAVYIHDTPHVEKFTRRTRFFSSGCVRIEEPLRLAQALLGPQYPRFTEALDSGRTVTLALARPVDVHLVYLMAWTDARGEACFRDDVYGYDPGVMVVASAFLPAADRTGVDVHEAGVGIVADAAGTKAQRGGAQPGGRDAGHLQVDRLAQDVEAVTRDAATTAAQGGIGRGRAIPRNHVQRP